MTLQHALALLLTLSIVCAGCLAPVPTDQETATDPSLTSSTTETDSIVNEGDECNEDTVACDDQKDRESPTEERTTSRLYGQCTLEVTEVDDEAAMNADESARQTFEQLTTDQQAEFLGNTTASKEGADWNSSVRYVQYDGEWYFTVIECP